MKFAIIINHKKGGGGGGETAVAPISFDVALTEEDFTLEIKAVDVFDYQNGVCLGGNVADEDYLLGSLIEVDEIYTIVENTLMYISMIMIYLMNLMNMKKLSKNQIVMFVSC